MSRFYSPPVPYDSATGTITTQQTSRSTLKRSAAGSTNILDLWNNRATGAANDAGVLRFLGSNDAGTTTAVALCQVVGTLTAATAGAHTSAFSITTAAAGSLATRFRINEANGINMSLPLGIGLASITTTPSAMVHARSGTAGGATLRMHEVGS